MKVKQMHSRPFPFALSQSPRAAAGRARVTRGGGRRGRRALRHPAGRAGGAKAPAVSAATLHRVEKSLLCALLDAHPNRDRALGRLLDDLELSEGAPGGPSPACRRMNTLSVMVSPASRRRIDELLVAATIGGHPTRRG